jgi:hypothetical protein
MRAKAPLIALTVLMCSSAGGAIPMCRAADIQANNLQAPAPSAAGLYHGLVSAVLSVQADSRGDVQDVLINGTSVLSLNYVDIQTVFNDQQTGMLLRSIARNPLAAAKAAELSNVLRGFGVFALKQVVVGVDGQTVYYLSNPAGR